MVQQLWNDQMWYMPAAKLSPIRATRGPAFALVYPLLLYIYILPALNRYLPTCSYMVIPKFAIMDCAVTLFLRDKSDTADYHVRCFPCGSQAPQSTHSLAIAPPTIPFCPHPYHLLGVSVLSKSVVQSTESFSHSFHQLHWISV